MKPRADLGVVDPELNVYGVKGLKVADMSILPDNVGANTFGTVRDLFYSVFEGHV